jgi:hypothetical protein
MEGGCIMEWSEVGQYIGKWAPALGAILAPATGGVSAVIGSGIGILTKALGVPEDSKPDDIMAMLTTDPEVRLKLMVAENEFKLKQREQDIAEIQIYLKDTDSARKMQSDALAQTDIFSKRFIYYYASALSFLTILYIFLVTFIDLPAGNRRLADTILGFLLGQVLATVIQFFFGTNAGSLAKNKLLEVKDQMIGKLTK